MLDVPAFWLCVRRYGMRWSNSARANVCVCLGTTLYDLDTGKREEF